MNNPMKINLVTDAKYHNLALMKISSFYKAYGNQVYLNGVGEFDRTIGSWLFDFSEKTPCDIEGGPGVDPKKRSAHQRRFPDYSLFPIDYSLGYTWEYCPRKCKFCVVPKMDPPRIHCSIWDFHDSKFNKICLMNNNTFSDPQWKETFEEIWDANLIVRDENGYDVRLLDDEKALALKKTKFVNNRLHFAWDLIEDDKEVLQGFEILKKYGLNHLDAMVYVLVGFNTTNEGDFYRLQKIHDFNMSPYVMPYDKKDRHLYAIKRFIDQRAYRQAPSIKEAWESYRYKE